MAQDRTLDVGNLIEGRSLGRPQIAIALWLCFLMVLEGYDMQTLSFAAPAILREWQVSRADFGLVLSAHLFGYMVGALILSVFGDRLGRKNIIVTGAMIFGAFTFAGGFATSPQELYLLRLGAGFGLGGAIPSGIALAADFRVMADDAKLMVDFRDREAATDGAFHETFAYGSNVGCNMAYRYSAIRDIVFDESMPAYAWHEDSDFRGQVERRGLFVRAENLWGVHLGHKQGRSSGLALGYSQIANAVYLARKGTVPAGFLAEIATKNVIVNALRASRDPVGV